MCAVWSTYATSYVSWVPCTNWGSKSSVCCEQSYCSTVSHWNVAVQSLISNVCLQVKWFKPMWLYSTSSSKEKFRTSPREATISNCMLPSEDYDALGSPLGLQHGTGLPLVFWKVYSNAMIMICWNIGNIWRCRAIVKRERRTYNSAVPSTALGKRFWNSAEGSKKKWTGMRHFGPYCSEEHPFKTLLWKQ